MDILLITTPPQHSTSNQAVIQNSKALKEWIDALPVMNVTETVSLLHEAVKPFNELQMDAAERLKLLEIYHQAFEEILYSYDELRLRTLPVSPEERKRISEDIMWLYLGLATGYKIIIKAGHNSGLSPKEDTGLLFSVCRAMELIFNAVIYAYKMHQPPPPLAFLEIKQLYLFARHHGVEDVRIKNIKGHSVPPTISNLFRHFLLINTLKPAKFDSGDLSELFMLLETYAPFCTYPSRLNQQANAEVYLVNLDDDEPATRAEEKNMIPDFKEQVLLDIQPALHAIRDRLQQADAANASLLEKNEARLLYKFLGEDDPSSSSGIRQPVSSNLRKLVTGYAAILKILGQKDLLGAISDVEVIDGIEVSNLDEDIATALSDWQFVEEKGRYQVLRGKKTASVVQLQTGDLVGLIESSASTHFTPVFLVGVVRKIQDVNEQETRLGLEMIPGQGVPFLFVAADKVPQQGIYFTAINALGRPASLLFRQSDIGQMKDLQVTLNKQTHQVKTDGVLLQTPNYIQYSYKIAG